MSDYIDYNDKNYLAGSKGFNDKPEREAIRKISKTCSTFNPFLIEYLHLDLDNEHYYFVDDPLGIKNVDMGFIRERDEKIICILELGVFTKWKGNNFPYNTGLLNRVDRKTFRYTKYPYPYLSIDLNVEGTCGIMTTKETELKYPLTEWPVYVKGVRKMQKGRRVLIEDTIKIGQWAA